MAHNTMPWILLTQLLLLALKVTAKVPAVIIFGDSTVDSGNNNQISTLIKSNFPPYGRDFEGGKPTGRFSNGRIFPDFISEAFNLKPSIPAYTDPMYSIKDFATGVCFASAGTGYDNVTSSLTSVIPLWEEMKFYKDYQKSLKAYLGMRKANEVLREALYVIGLGTNDFALNYYILPKRAVQYTVQEFGNFLLGIAEKLVKDLYSLGARKIGIGGLPPIGCLPLVRTLNFLNGNRCVKRYNKVATDFNVKLQVLVVKLNKELPGINLKYADTYDILLDTIQNPSKYGFEKADVACCGTGKFEMSYLCEESNPFTCNDANKFVFWDSFHPTTKTYRLIADHLMNTTLTEFL